jgi:hypothetical protein
VRTIFAFLREITSPPSWRNTKARAIYAQIWQPTRFARVRLSTWKANSASLKCRVSCLYAKNPILLRATPVTEDTPGYQQLLELLGGAEDCLVAMEATGHYWRIFTQRWSRLDLK